MTQFVCPACLAPNRLPVDREPGAARCGRCKGPLFTGHPVEVDAAGLTAHRRGTKGGVGHKSGSVEQPGDAAGEIWLPWILYVPWSRQGSDDAAVLNRFPAVKEGGACIGRKSGGRSIGGTRNGRRGLLSGVGLGGKSGHHKAARRVMNAGSGQ